jgi:ribonuclease BN (tRNA processing enzyme)
MPPTTVTFAGTGDALGSGGRLQTCIHVDAPDAPVLLDCGASALPALTRVEVDLDAVETVLLTHLHGDHFAGLPFLVLDAQPRTGRTVPLTIVGPPGTESRVKQAVEVLFPGLSEVEQDFELEYVEFANRDTVSLDGVAVTPFRVV